MFAILILAVAIPSVVVYASKRLLAVRASAPRGITWVTRSIDLGVLGSMQPINLDYGFTNNTEKPVTLAPEACCGFRSIVIPASVLPGESGKVTITGESPLSTSGEPDKRVIMVKAREIRGFRQPISFSYSVVPIWHPVPLQVTIGPIVEGAEGRATLRIYMERGAKEPAAASTLNPLMTVRRLVVKSGDFAEYEVRATSRVGSHDPVLSTCTVSAAGSPESVFNVAVRVDVQPCASLSPDKVFLDELPVSRNGSATVQIRGLEAIKAVSVEKLPPGVIVRLKRLAPNLFSARLRVTRSTSGPFSETVKVRITTRHSFTVDLPIVGMAID